MHLNASHARDVLRCDACGILGLVRLIGREPQVYNPSIDDDVLRPDPVRPGLVLQFGKQPPADRAIIVGRHRRGGGVCGTQRPHQIAPADNANDLVAAYDWYAFDAVRLQQPCDLAEIGLFSDRDHGARHDVLDGAAVRLDVLPRLHRREILEPPRALAWATRLGADFWTVQQVAFADDANELAAGIHNRS